MGSLRAPSSIYHEYTSSFLSPIKLNNLIHNDAFGVNINRTLDTYLLQKSLEVESSHLLKAVSQLLSYHRFANDDKYFLLDNSGFAYVDTQHYNFFYDRLNTSSSYTRLKASHPSSLWIFPRAQYGHFIYDEVIPPLFAYYSLTHSFPRSISLLVSAGWQRQVLEDFCINFAGFTPDIYVHVLPERDTMFVIDSGVFALSRLPEALEVAKQYLTIKHCTSRSDVALRKKYFLSRVGFGMLDRLHNRKGINRFLVDNDFVHLRPHEMKLSELRDLMKDAALVLSEPGTTGLISYLCAPSCARLVNMLSARCLTQCTPRFAYSGWRYHMPWINRVEFLWGKPIKALENPFSDICEYNMDHLRPYLSTFS